MQQWNFDNISSVLNSLPKPLHLALLGGNNGDSLIHMGAATLLKTIGESSVPIGDARSVLVVGSGALTYRDFSSLNHLEALEMIKLARDKELVLLPFSTLQGNAVLLAELLNPRTAPTWVYCRDAISHTLLQPLLASHIALDIGHDTAFALAGTPFLQHLSEHTKDEHVLVVERFDIEGSTKPPSLFRIPEELRSVVPEPLRRLLKSLFLRRIYFSTPFVEQIRETLPYAMRDLPLVAADISQQQNYSFDLFSSLIAEAACIHSTRLHVAILAAMLEKPTVLYAGKNHKFRGIYELSMSHLNHVTLA